MLEAIKLCEEIACKKLNWTYSETNRIGDHIWYISDINKFGSQFTDWDFKYSINDILEEIFLENTERRL